MERRKRGSAWAGASPPGRARLPGAAPRGKARGGATRGEARRRPGGGPFYRRGGTLPFFRSLPFKRGFTNIRRVEYAEVNLDRLAEFPAGAELNPGSPGPAGQV